MKTPLLLKTCSHSIFSPAVIAAKVSAEENHPYDNQAPSVTATIDFENGNFKLEGDWHFMMTCNKHAEPEWFNYHTSKVCIETSIYPSSIIDLSDYKNDGAVFILEGNIKDHDNNLSACSGLLVLDKITENNKMNTNIWNICFYLYDNNNEDCEIAFKIPVYVSRLNTTLN